jgi:acyl-CoA synthetase (AMP-forming)/AMP-acid ligase II
MPDADLKPYPTLIEERSRDTPDRIYAIIPKSTDVQDGYKDFTYKQLAKAVDKMSWWLDQSLGKSVDLDTVAYMGANDLRYTFLYIAAVKTRRKVTLILLVL